MTSTETPTPTTPIALPPPFSRAALVAIASAVAGCLAIVAIVLAFAGDGPGTRDPIIAGRAPAAAAAATTSTTGRGCIDPGDELLVGPTGLGWTCHCTDYTSMDRLFLTDAQQARLASYPRC